MLTSKVAIIGGGPVGLLGCLLLEKFNIDYVCIEKSQKLRSHPSAHWVSARSKQIMSQIPGLAQTIDQCQEAFDHFKYYRYCQAIGGRQFGSTNHFQPSIQQKISLSHSLFGQYPNHISQSKLLNIEYETLKEKQRIIFNQQISSISKTQEGYLLLNSKRETVAKSEYVILSNGFNSSLRSQLGIEVGGGKQFYRLVNIHFKSLELAQLIKSKNCEAMLHFVYNQKIPCVLVNHSLNQGEFVLQIPNYEPFIDLLKVYTPSQLLETAFSSQDFSSIKKNLQIIHVGRWKLQAQIASKMYKDNIFLAGDTAHTYTPAGGFGMNAGFQDINQLAHTLHLLNRNPKANQFSLRQMYNVDRLNTNQKYLQKSLRNYKLTDEIANQLGFPSQLTQYYFSFCRFLPQTSLSFGMQLSQKMRLLAMKGLFAPKEVKPQLNLFFDQFDYNVQGQSKLTRQIIKSIRNNQYFDVWVDDSIKRDEISAIFGQIEEQNIKRIKMPEGEKIVRMDGIVMK